MVFVNYATLGGLLFVIKGEKHIVEPLTMRPLKFYKEHNMICQ